MNSAWINQVDFKCSDTHLIRDRKEGDTDTEENAKWKTQGKMEAEIGIMLL